MKTFFNILFIFIPLISFEQNLILKEKIDLYENGKIKAKYSVINDTCKNGPYSEYYENGTIKTEGQYKYIITDKVWGYNPEPPFVEEWLQVNDTGCYKVGQWNFYDNNGGKISTSFFILNQEYIVEGKPKDSTIYINQDSATINLIKYSDCSSYNIKRTKNNKKLIIVFPYFAMHNYWSIYTKEQFQALNLDLLKDSLDLIEYASIKFGLDDCSGRIHNYDFGTLANGSYIIVYTTQHGYFRRYEKITININNI